MTYSATTQTSELLQIVKDRPIDVLSWFLYNIVIGTTFIWLSWLLNIYQSSQVGWIDNILNGSLAVFVLTLTATQASFFTEVTGQSFKDFKKLGLGLFFIIVIVSSITAAAASSAAARQIQHPENSSALIWVSIVLLVLATVLCLFLYVARLASEAGAEGMMEERVNGLTQKAESETEVDGTKL